MQYVNKEFEDDIITCKNKKITKLNIQFIMKLTKINFNDGRMSLFNVSANKNENFIN